MKIKCEQCAFSWCNEGEDFPTCHADPNWPAPCEEEEYLPYGYDDCEE